MSREYKLNLIWHYFSKGSEGDKHAICNQCSKKFSYLTSTTNLKKHLKSMHSRLYNLFVANRRPVHRRPAYTQMVPSTSKSEEVPSTSTDQVMQMEVTHATQFVTTTSETKTDDLEFMEVPSFIRTEDNTHIDAMLLKFIVTSYQRLSIVGEKYFIEFVATLNPNYTLPEREVLSNTLIPALYNTCLEEQQYILQEATTICLTTDSWTSAKMDSFISVTAHFITDQFEFKSVLLRCSEIKGEQTSQNLASIIMQICTDWDIIDKINLCITDDSENVVDAVNIIEWPRRGCVAHKLNIVMQHSLSLMDDKLDKIKKIISRYRSNYEDGENLVYQTDEQEANQPLALLSVVPPKWSSTYSIIERFLTTSSLIGADMTTDIPDSDFKIITDEEWNTLTQLCKVLKPFDEATKELSGEKYVCASKAFAVINGLKDVMQELKKKSDYDAVIPLVESIESQLNSSFHNIEIDEYYYLCTILDPRYKTSMFIDEKAAELAKSKLISKVLDVMKDEIGTAETSTAESECSRTDDEEVSLWRRRKLVMNKRRGNPNSIAIAQQEVESYLLDEFADNSQSPCEWWRSEGWCKYPRLAKIFKTECNIVATSAPAQWLFTEAGRTLIDSRSLLPRKQTEQLVFLNENLKNSDYIRLVPKIIVK